ncbi:MAG: hypothetical protein JKX75_10135 [Gammaproteobacteria bacterium]|nr:hypothetical protein [Gammaproteobacteria bacterium]
MVSNNQLLLNNEHRLLGLMLFSLLAAVHLGDNDSITQGFLIAHFGFFLLWQPVVKKELTFNTRQLIILSILIFSFIYWFNPWTNVFWSLLLLTLLTGRIFARGLSRAAYGIAVIVLFLDLILNTAPGLFDLAALSSTLRTGFSTLLMLLPLTLLFFPVTDTATKQVDFIRGFFVVLLVIFLCMSSILISVTSTQTYIESLAISIFTLSTFLLTAALLWAPRADFSGIAKLWEKYILDIGGPFEQWITHVSTLESNTSLRSENFLAASVRYLMQQHWICGVSWQTNTDDGIEGEKSSYSVNIDDEKLKLTVYTHTPVGPSLFLHAKLLLSVLTFYYRAKLQEQQLIKQAHLQAIHETGSKLTHDMKNILQSTHTMTQIVNDKDSDLQEIIDVLKKQMPLLTQRLNTTLEKLKSPNSTDAATQGLTGSVLQWWNQLLSRYTGHHIEFSADIENDIEIPLDIFTTVIENLLDNAKSKRIREPDLKIHVELSNINNRLQLSVTDNGSAINKHVEKLLFNEVVSSQDGFGIGLYQSHELAKNHGYELSVHDNTAGQVCFRLCKTT